MSNGNDSPSENTAGGSRRFHRVCYAIAVAVTVLWFCFYARYRKDGFCDEAGHFGILYHFAEAKPGLPDNLTTPPGYHFVVLTLSRGHPNDTWPRFTTMLFALLALGGFAGAWREFHRRPGGAATLLFALLPIMQPFTGMAYSDVPGIAVLLWAWWAQLRGRYFFAGVLLVLSCLIRQTNVVWGAFFLAWEILRALRDGGPRKNIAAACRIAADVAWQRGRWILLTIAACAAIVLVTGRFTPSLGHGNEFKPNLATLHFAGLLVLFLGLPVWIAHSGDALRRFAAVWRSQPARALAGTLLGAALVAVLTLAFRNSHEWNRELFWSDPRFTLLRNWPLVYAEKYLLVRVAMSLGVVLAAVALSRLFQGQRNRRDLWLILPFALVLLGTNSLVEPRYFITPAVFLLFFLETERRSFLLLASWFALVCAVHAPFVVFGRSLW